MFTKTRAWEWASKRNIAKRQVMQMVGLINYMKHPKDPVLLPAEMLELHQAQALMSRIITSWNTRNKRSKSLFLSREKERNNHAGSH